MDGYRDAAKFIEFCKKCRQYGNCWACPPFDFDPREQLAGYEIMYILGVKITPSPEMTLHCSSPERNMETERQLLAEVRRKIDPMLLQLEQKHRGTRAFFAGTCMNCPEGKCRRKEEKTCIHPDLIRPSLESFGFDIGKTSSQLLGIDLQWSTDGCLPRYYTLVSGLMSKRRIDPAPVWTS